MKIKTYPMNQSTILRLFADKEEIEMSPAYQRNGGIWGLKARQLLIDSILNEFDIPKLYFHVVDPVTSKYSVIDGRQRLETIFKFIDGDFSLADDFEYYADIKAKIGGLTYHQIAEKFPKVKIRFDATALPVILVETDDEDLIDDMFSRLNEAAPLNAAEKRNAFGGPVVAAITKLSTHKLFTEKVRFKSKRYQHREVAARILFLEDSISRHKKLFDTKKEYLDEFAKNKKNTFDLALCTKATRLLDEMSKAFGDQDSLLRSQSIVPIYYLLTREADAQGMLQNAQRSKLVEFRDALDTNRVAAEEDISKANYDLLEFDRLSQQGTNDASSIEKRLQIIAEVIGLEKSKIEYV